MTGDTDDALRALVERARREASDGKRVGVLAMREDVDVFGQFPVTLSELGSSGDLAGVAARFYAALREIDAAGVDLILAREPAGDEGLGRALRDRLRRAASEIVRL